MLREAQASPLGVLGVLGGQPFRAAPPKAAVAKKITTKAPRHQGKIYSP
jgi:hypothetical protein